jgi:hypothetical protein
VDVGIPRHALFIFTQLLRDYVHGGEFAPVAEDHWYVFHFETFKIRNFFALLANYCLHFRAEMAAAPSTKHKRAKKAGSGARLPVAMHEAVEQYKIKKHLDTDDQAAKALGIKRDILKNIKSHRTPRKRGLPTVKAVREKIDKVLGRGTSPPARP